MIQSKSLLGGEERWTQAKIADGNLKSILYSEKTNTSIGNCLHL